MAVSHWNEHHYGHSDIELQIPRQSCLTSYCTAPQAPDPLRPYDGLVLVLHGYGSLASDDYLTNLRGYLAEKYNLLAVVVDYHASGLHPVNPFQQYAVSSDFFQHILEYLSGQQKAELASWAIEVDGRSGWLKFKERGLNVFLDIVTQIERLKDVQFVFSLKSIAGNLDHQNFGVIQALDVLTALNDVSAKYSFDKNNIVAFGSSHGGYLAHLCAKFAPNTLRAVIESSSYPQTPPYLVSNRHYPDIAAYFSCVFSRRHFPVFFDTPWELNNQSSPYCFGMAQRSVRDLSSSGHWAAVRQNSKRLCQFRMMHSSRDEVFQSIDEKHKQVMTLSEAGFDVVYKEMGEADVDGKLVKHLDHGMGSSMRAIFDMFYPTLRRTSGDSDAQLETEIEFRCGETTYRINHGRRPMLSIGKSSS